MSASEPKHDPRRLLALTDDELETVTGGRSRDFIQAGMPSAQSFGGSALTANQGQPPMQWQNSFDNPGQGSPQEWGGSALTDNGGQAPMDGDLGGGGFGDDGGGWM